MKQLTINNKTITENDIYVIAEIGCNHNGDFERACRMVQKAAECGADAVKFQKRYNDILFTKELLDSPYENENAYGKTYGEHRDALDWFDKNEFVKLRNLAHSLNIDFIVTPFEWKSAMFLDSLGIDAFKIASCDIKTPALIEQVARYEKPVILSTGGAKQWEVGAATEILSRYHSNYAILHCVSLYPNTDRDLNLCRIKELAHSYPCRIIGFSSHHPSIISCINAYWMGARIFEVHFTLNRADKGTDHGFSLEPEGLRRLCNDLKRIPIMIGTGEYNPGELDGFVKKFGKSPYAMNNMRKGDTIWPDLFSQKAPKNGICVSKWDKFAGKRLKNQLIRGQVLTEADIEP